MINPDIQTPLVRADGPYAGLFDAWITWSEDNPYNPSWQPPDGYSSNALFAVHAPYPEWVELGAAWTAEHGWERAVADPDGLNGWRLPTDAERLQRAITARIVALKAEVEDYIDTSIQPVTRDMLRDGVLDDALTDSVRAFIAACYVEANTTIDAIEAVEAIDQVDDPAPVWPLFGGAA